MVELGSNVACGGILRDSNGCFLVVFATRLHHVSVLEAELWGIYHGLKLSWERGFRKIRVYSVSLIAVKLRKDGCPPYSSFMYPCGKCASDSSE
ncbi:putative non-LTR retroelement reverse transcriptase [Trifolium medium]|uniref:Putative non-LTR retroelement reverse transcriptase n=1 Tax=Trifolium medium TaxID=97028 RepID=A0A392NK35_9FABA|nr:putative non-LTR retroelement reverse transcriptase [Trifolium medium]